MKGKGKCWKVSEIDAMAATVVPCRTKSTKKIGYRKNTLKGRCQPFNRAGKPVIKGRIAKRIFSKAKWQFPTKKQVGQQIRPRKTPARTKKNVPLPVLPGVVKIEPTGNVEADRRIRNALMGNNNPAEFRLVIPKPLPILPTRRDVPVGTTENDFTSILTTTVNRSKQVDQTNLVYSEKLRKITSADKVLIQQFLNGDISYLEFDQLVNEDRLMKNLPRIHIPLRGG